MRRKPLPRWAKVVLWVVAGAATTFAGFALWLAAMFSGGLDDLLDAPGPYASDAAVVAARERVRPANQRELSKVAVPGTVVATAAGSRCEEGIHDWKRDDPYDLSCNLTDAVLVAGDLSAFRADMLGLEGSVTASGWQSSGLSIGRVMSEYWDAGGRAPKDLPQVRYDTAGYGKALRVGWTDSTAPEAQLGSFSDDVQWRDGSGAPISARRAAELVGAGRYGVIVELEQGYFEE